jgi:hypothetical protein
MILLGKTKAMLGLSEWAGRQVGLPDPVTPAAVAESPEALVMRDTAWADYHRRLADHPSYTLDEIRLWLADHGIEVSLASVSRDRAPIQAWEERHRLAAEATKRFLDATAGADESEVFQAARKCAGNLFLETLQKFDAEGLAKALEGGDVIRLANAVSRMSTAHVQTQVLQERLAAMRREVAKAVAVKAKAAADGRLTREDVYKILDEVMKGSAA